MVVISGGIGRKWSTPSILGKGIKDKEQEKEEEHFYTKCFLHDNRSVFVMKYNLYYIKKF